ncbi:MAG: anaerobic ribonucleoside-triphosphate reductase activating protein [Lachnospiraceae bacterium]|nr:anaerobic ribonucleoside-triphosphate reductase activating protein [Lachnospiraceae bacterium]
MNYGNIKKNDIANGLGVRISLFVSGCTNKCKGCFQPETWDPAYGEEFTQETEEEILAELGKPWYQGITLLGGEPLEPYNQEGIARLLRRIKKELPAKDVWLYTGNLFEDMLPGGFRCYSHTQELLSYLDVLVDGRFVEEKKNIRLKFRGSENQRVIDVKKSLTEGSVCLLDL